MWPVCGIVGLKKRGRQDAGRYYPAVILVELSSFQWGELNSVAEQDQPRSE